MLRLNSRPVTLACSASQIALRVAKQPPQVSAWPSVGSLEAALSPFATQLADKAVTVMLSNDFCRYVTLPWQDGMYSRQEWLSFARHSFKQVYGAIAEQWQMTVNLDTYAAPVLAAAIDQALVNELQACAARYKFAVQAIVTPVSQLLYAQSPTQKAGGLQCYCLLEPEVVCLLLLDAQGVQTVQVLRMANDQLAQLPVWIARFLLQHGAEPERTRIMALVSSALKPDWDSLALPDMTLLKPLGHMQMHAAWLAGLV